MQEDAYIYSDEEVPRLERGGSFMRYLEVEPICTIGNGKGSTWLLDADHAIRSAYIAIAVGVFGGAARWPATLAKMKFLCLHGAIGNTENFSIQLLPLEKELASKNVASFHYINGPCVVDPPEGFEQYFGIGPHFRWIDDGGQAETSMMTRVRQLPNGETPEDVLRASSAASNITTMEWRNRTELLDRTYKILEADPEIQCVVGYSEGACFAASLILDEMQRLQKEGRPRRLKCAMFITGWPPLGPEGEIVLADESDLRIDIPTLHVIGANDPYKVGAIALFNVCNPDTALLFDTGKGHTIPRAGLVLQEWREAIEEMLALAERT